MNEPKTPRDEMDIFSELARVHQPLAPDPDFVPTSSNPLVQWMLKQGMKVTRRR